MTRTHLLAAILGLILSTPLRVYGEPTRFDCGEQIIRGGIGFDPRLAPKISSRNTISPELGEALYYLDHSFKNEISSLPSAARKKCEQAGQRTREALMYYFHSRFALLKKMKRLELIYEELGNLFAAVSDEKARNTLSSEFRAIQNWYITQIHHSLIGELSLSPWSHYSKLKPNLEVWDASWSKLMKREISGAIQIGTGAVGLRATAHAPDTLKIVLFHELAHLNAGSSDESLAWRETFDYLDWLEKNGRKIPAHFEAVRTQMRTLGFERWLKATRPVLQ